MITILYNDLMEPITAINLNPEAYFCEQDAWVIPVLVEPAVTPITESDSILEPFYIVTVRRERFIRKGREYKMFFVHDLEEELALSLKSEFLAGQQSELRRRVDYAFFQGIVCGSAGT